MLLRRKNIERLMHRSWNRIIRGSVIFRQYHEAQDDGFLNAVKSIEYIDSTVENCGINLNPSKKETYAGVETDCDAIVYVPLYCINGIEISELVPSDKDLINIGGILNQGIIEGGEDYTISDIDRPDSVYEGEFLLRLGLKKR